MKKAIIYCLALIASVDAYAGDKEKKNLTGDVKSFTEYQYDAKGRAEAPAKVSLKPVTAREFNHVVFNEKGFVLEEKSLLNDSTVLGNKVIKYAKDSIESEKIYEGEVLAESLVYERDKKNRPVRISVSGSKGLMKSYTYSYNEDDNSLTWQVLNPANEIFKQLPVPQNIYFLNKDGFPDSVHHYTFANPTTMIKATRSVWKYDDKNRLVHYIDYFKNDSVKLDQKWNYSNGAFADSLIETEYLYSRQLKQRTTHYYDDKGNAKRKVFYVHETNLTENWTYNYDMDEKGNWTRKITLLNSKPVAIAERKIEYFTPIPPKP